MRAEMESSNRKSWFALAIAALLLLGGCAIGVKHDFDQKGLDLGASTTASVAVGTLDHRPYVVSGEKAADFVGLSRGGFGNPFDVTTQSGKPLASDMTSTIVASLKGKGVDAKGVELRHSLSLDDAKRALSGAGTQRSVLLLLQEWKGDAMVNVGLSYDLALSVLDSNGNTLVTKVQRAEKERLGAADPFTPGGAAQVVPRFRRMLETLFQSPEITGALRP